MRGMGWDGMGAKVLQAYRQTYRASDEAGSRGAISPNNGRAFERGGGV